MIDAHSGADGGGPSCPRVWVTSPISLLAETVVVALRSIGFDARNARDSSPSSVPDADVLLLVLDVVGEEGLLAAEELMRWRPGPWVVVVSGAETGLLQRRLRVGGAVAVVAPTITLEDLGRVLRAAVARELH